MDKNIENIRSFPQDKVCIPSYDHTAFFFCDFQNDFSLCLIYQILHGFSCAVAPRKRIGKQPFLWR